MSTNPLIEREHSLRSKILEGGTVVEDTLVDGTFSKTTQVREKMYFKEKIIGNRRKLT
jgi:hypothetical protein